MNRGEAISFWLEVFGWLALEITLVTAVVAGWQLLARSARWRRGAWQAGLLGAAMLLAVETTGIGPGMAHWALLRLYISPGSAKVSPAPAKAAGQSPAAARYDDHDAAPAPVAKIPWWPARVWLAGTLLLLAWVLISRTMLFVFRWRHRRTATAAVREQVRRLAWKMGLRRNVQVMISPHLSTPIAFGVFRPMVALPARFGDSFTRDEQDAMLAHELTHLAHHDPAWYLACDLVAAALWWHPLVWWARWQIHARSEDAADEGSLIVENGPELLAGCLITVARRLTRTPSFGWVSMAGNGFRSNLGRRIERLLDLQGHAFEPARRSHSMAFRLVGSGLLAGLAVICTAASTLPPSDKPITRSVRVSWANSVAGHTLMETIGTDDPRALVETKTKPVESAAVEMRLAQVATKKAADPVQAQRPRAPINTSAGRRALKAKLDSIVLPTLEFDAVPLNEVIKQLREEAQKRDPEKRGVNFLINSALGQPATNTAAARRELDSVLITIKPALHDLTLAQALDVVTKMSEYPLNVSLEDYAVVIYSPGPGAAPLNTRTYQADPNTFQQGLQNVTPRNLPNNNGTGTGGNGRNGNGSPGQGGGNGASLKSFKQPPVAGVRQQKIRDRLNELEVGEIVFNGKPLKYVMDQLAERARLADPEFRGVQLRIHSGEYRTVTDRQTGTLAVRNDLAEARINIAQPLQDLTLRMALDAVVRAADRPIKYMINDRGITFVSAEPRPSPAYSRVYSVNNAKFAEALGGRSPEKYFGTLGVRECEFFYSGTLKETGRLMVRASGPEQAAVEVLLENFVAAK